MDHLQLLFSFGLFWALLLGVGLAARPTEDLGRSGRRGQRAGLMGARWVEG